MIVRQKRKKNFCANILVDLREIHAVILFPAGDISDFCVALNKAQFQVLCSFTKSTCNLSDFRVALNKAQFQVLCSFTESTCNLSDFRVALNKAQFQVLCSFTESTCSLSDFRVALNKAKFQVEVSCHYISNLYSIVQKLF